MTSILFVCTGNICRSPTAEGVLRALAQRLAPSLSLEVDSAGTHDYHAGEPPDARAQHTAAAHGVDLSSLRARQLCLADFDRFDQVLVMDRANLAVAIRLLPPGACADVRLLLDYLPAQPLREVPDPYHAGAAIFEQVYVLCYQAAMAVLERLSGPNGYRSRGKSSDHTV